MNIETKYNIGDKVIYLDDDIEPMYETIVDVTTYTDEDGVEVEYGLENGRTINGSYLFTSVEDLIDCVIEKMNSLK